MTIAIDPKLMIINEARCLGHAEAKTAERRRVADALVREGVLALGGTMSAPRGAKWYRLADATPRVDPDEPHGEVHPDSPRVRFTHPGPLGASRADDLCHVVADTYGVGDGGRLAFEHPNPKLTAEGWVYVEVAGKSDPGQRYYVGVPLAWLEPVPATGDAVSTEPAARSPQRGG